MADVAVARLGMARSVGSSWSVGGASGAALAEAVWVACEPESLLEPRGSGGSGISRETASDEGVPARISLHSVSVARWILDNQPYDLSAPAPPLLPTRSELSSLAISSGETSPSHAHASPELFVPFASDPRLGVPGPASDISAMDLSWTCRSDGERGDGGRDRGPEPPPALTSSPLSPGEIDIPTLASPSTSTEADLVPQPIADVPLTLQRTNSWRVCPERDNNTVSPSIASPTDSALASPFTSLQASMRSGDGGGDGGDGDPECDGDRRVGRAYGGKRSTRASATAAAQAMLARAESFINSKAGRARNAKREAAQRAGLQMSSSPQEEVVWSPGSPALPKGAKTTSPWLRHGFPRERSMLSMSSHSSSQRQMSTSFGSFGLSTAPSATTPVGTPQQSALRTGLMSPTSPRWATLGSPERRRYPSPSTGRPMAPMKPVEARDSTPTATQDPPRGQRRPSQALAAQGSRVTAGMGAGGGAGGASGEGSRPATAVPTQPSGDVVDVGAAGSTLRRFRRRWHDEATLTTTTMTATTTMPLEAPCRGTHGARGPRLKLAASARRSEARGSAVALAMHDAIAKTPPTDAALSPQPPGAMQLQAMPLLRRHYAL